ncbi:MAG TPA: hypothetical protein VGR28_14855 [Candidatus Thermoplasmatota archaeon]|jgi:hypothetical protein|nr:hypothetical protein [Candidatus Thermoplasmatota archaeon]
MAPGTQERIEGQTITDVIERLAALGYDTHLMAKEGGMVLCAACGQRSAARDVAMERIARMEGPSDPGSEVLIAGVMCPQCGARGALTLTYGPMASDVDSEVLLALRDERPTARSAEAATVPRG